MNQLQYWKRINRIKDPKFEKCYVLKPGFNYEVLTQFCREVVYVTDGEETDIDLIAAQIAKTMEIFNPATDCFLPAGSGIVSFLAGVYFQKKFVTADINIAFYKKKKVRYGEIVSPETYIFYRFSPQYILDLGE